jgi:hypothetical protein
MFCDVALAARENVLGMAIAEAPERVTPAGIEVRRSGDAESGTWLRVVTRGFAHPDDQGAQSHERFPDEVLARAERDLTAAGAIRYVLVSGRGEVLWRVRRCGEPEGERHAPAIASGSKVASGR